MAKPRMTKIEKDFHKRIVALIEANRSDEITSIEWLVFTDLQTGKTY